MLPYREKLNLLNEELGTQYKIPTNEELAVTDMTVQELNDFYTSMDLNEFEEYILEMHDQNAQNSEAEFKMLLPLMMEYLLERQKRNNSIIIHPAIVIILH